MYKLFYSSLLLKSTYFFFFNLVITNNDRNPIWYSISTYLSKLTFYQCYGISYDKRIFSTDTLIIKINTNQI